MNFVTDYHSNSTAEEHFKLGTQTNKLCHKTPSRYSLTAPPFSKLQRASYICSRQVINYSVLLNYIHMSLYHGMIPQYILCFLLCHQSMHLNFIVHTNTHTLTRTHTCKNTFVDSFQFHSMIQPLVVSKVFRTLPNNSLEICPYLSKFVNFPLSQLIRMLCVIIVVRIDVLCIRF